jgi:hypothetical protein
LPLLLDAGAEAVVVGFDASTDPLTARETLARLGFDPPRPFLVIVEGSPAVAAAAGAGVLLAERGISTAEARRSLGSGGILGRIVGSPDAATAAAGADFLVVDHPSPTRVAARAVVEAAWAPVLARVSLATKGSAIDWRVWSARASKGSCSGSVSAPNRR